MNGSLRNETLTLLQYLELPKCTQLNRKMEQKSICNLVSIQNTSPLFVLLAGLPHQTAGGLLTTAISITPVSLNMG